MKTITVTIDQVGRPKIEANGFAGCGCTDATRPIENAFSTNPADKVVDVKPEMHQGGEMEHHLYQQ